MNFITRSNLNLPLTPGERAFLKVLKGLVVTALAAAFMAAAQMVPAGHTVSDWGSVFFAAAITFVTSCAFALDKYWTAQGDIIPGAVAGEVGTAVGELGKNAPHIPA